MKHPIALRVDADLLPAAKRHAQVENRTLTNFVETVLRQHIAKTGGGLDQAPGIARSRLTQRINGKPAHD
jgi:hypothetical protein